MISYTETLSQAIRDVPDFPKPGILFKDITPVLANPDLMEKAIDGMIEISGIRQVDKVVGIDARGFIFGSVIAHKLRAGFIPLRKKGKLPFHTHGIEYALEYGTNSIEVHQDAIREGETVLLADDLLATGGTAAAGLSLIRKLGGNVLCSVFFIELTALEGRRLLGEQSPVHSLLQF